LVETLILHMKIQSKNSKILELLILRILERQRERERLISPYGPNLARRVCIHIMYQHYAQKC